MTELTLTLRQPAQIGDRSRDDFVLGTLDYIPGAVVRGAFAAAWLARNGASRPRTPRREEFLRLFEGPVRFGALLRAGTEFAPLSVLSHKYPAEDGCPVREYDLAMDDAAPLSCGKCLSPLEPSKRLRGGQPGKKRRTSVSISDSGVALKGQLFTRETLEAGQDFTGTLVAPGARELEALLALGPVRVGGRRTTHGLAAVSLKDAAEPPAAQVRPDGKLIIRLRSPGIFTDKHGRPIPEPDQAELRHVLGADARVERRWTRWQQAGGWHVASGLPKPAELAVAAGSTYLIDAGPVAPSTLAALGRRGLGLRRHEGFGDLAPAPVLEDGKSAREDKARHQRQLIDKVITLCGFSARYPRAWPEVRKALRGHASGLAQATATLRRVADHHPDESVKEALRAFLEMPPHDAAYVAGELTSQ